MTIGRRGIASIDGQDRVWFLRRSSRVVDTVAVDRFIDYARQDVLNDGYRLTDDAPVVLLDELFAGHLVRFGFTEEPGNYEGRPST